MGSPTYIRLSKYLLHVGQLHQVRQLGSYGDTSVTSISTVQCLYFEGASTLTIDGPVRSADLKHQVLLAPTVAVVIGDRIVSIVDQFGNALQENARVVRVEKFTKRTAGVVLQQCEVEFN